MSWVTFETAGGGLVAVQPRHVAAIYDEQGIVKLSTTAGDVLVLARSSVRQAIIRLGDTPDAGTPATG